MIGYVRFILDPLFLCVKSRFMRKFGFGSSRAVALVKGAGCNAPVSWGNDGGRRCYPAATCVRNWGGSGLCCDFAGYARGYLVDGKLA